MTLEKFNNAHAVVTGGASGLGAATAQRLAANGMQVSIFDMQVERGEALAKLINGFFVQVDVSNSESVSTGLSSASEKLGPIRVLVNCAGIAVVGKTVSRGAPHDAAQFAKTININLIGSFNCASQAAALMVAADPLDADGTRGVIVNTASVAAYDGQVGQVAYATSKGGIVGMTLPMARDLADKGIRVCSLAPGLFETPLLQDIPEEARESLGKQVPFPSRLGKPEEYASLVSHILENSMLNGEVIRLDGAIRMAPR